MMIQKRKKLSNVKYQGTHREVLNPLWLNDVNKGNFHICSKPLFEISELTKMNEVVRDSMKLKTFLNYFFKKLFNCMSGVVHTVVEVHRMNL